MHGEEFPPEVYTYLPKDRRDQMRKIKTLLVRDGFELRLDGYASAPGVVDAWLLDSGAGSGKVFDWQAARAQLGGRQGSSSSPADLCRKMLAARYVHSDRGEWTW